MELINSTMRKGIKTMCIVCQTAQVVYLMPKPKDFVTRIVGDVVYLSAQVKILSDEMNKLLDSYAEIPGNYLMTQMNSITGSLSNITNRVSTYAQNAVDQALGLGENIVQEFGALTGGVIDAAGEATKAVVSLGSAIAESGSNIIGQTDVASDIHDGTEVILEWTGNGFNNATEKVTSSLNDVTNKINDAKQTANGKIEDKANEINQKIEDAQKFVSDIITGLRDKMKKLEEKLDGGFKDVTGMNSVANESDKIRQALKESGNDSVTAQATDAIASSLSYVIKNFSIGKAVTAFTGLLTQSVIVRLGLNELPPIDFESMLCKVRSDMEMSTEDLYNQYNKITKELDDDYNDYIKFGEDAVKIPSEDRDYNMDNYKEFIKTYEGELKTQRDKIRTLMKYNTDTNGESDAVVKKELRSAIKEVQKYRKQVKNAKQAKTLQSIIGDELDNLKSEAQYRLNSIRDDWKDMMQQYKDAVKEIKEFFSKGGSCDMFIDDCCDRINKDCNDIKDLCKNLVTQLIGSTVKVAMPADIGTVFPNPAYKIADFWMDIKTILKFIKDLISLILDIILHINKLARLMLNGINSLVDCFKQLMELLGLKWLMDLIQSIIDMFGDNITNAKARLENTLSPVYFNDTDEYNNTIEAFDEILENQKVSKNNSETLADTINLLKSISNKEIDKLISKIEGVKKMSTIKDSKVDDIEELIDELDAQGEQIVAYKSPILEESGSRKTVSGIVDNGEEMDQDIKLIGWHYFHPNLNHTNNTYYGTGLIDRLLKKIKSKIIKKAAKTGHKKKGGIAKLKIANVGRRITKIDKAYVAFYWYTYYTEDLEKECFDQSVEQGTMIIDSIVQTQNGSVVQIVDADGKERKVFVANNMVRSGDFVNVEGVRYRVK